MSIIADYQIATKIYESPNSLVYRARSNVDDRCVILKVLKQDYPIPSELTRYKQEYEIIRSLDIEGAIVAYDLLSCENSIAIVLEDFGAESLDLLMQSQRFTLSEFIQIAIQTAKALAEIHGANIIHKDINPSNIVLNHKTGQVKIIDFGISTIFARENPAMRNRNASEGTLAYISPEQTGRMNRSLDYRTDFYSLGATFYKVLTQQLVFENRDDLELVHCHLAREPIAPHKVEPSIPKTISQIIMKLLAKTSEDRYQSALGLKADLEECCLQLEQTGKITEFSLARHDLVDKLQIPQKLYGRTSEIKTLLKAFERVVNGGGVEWMLVAGYSGIGKSALVRELYKPITEKRGYFISGKFDQFQRNIPYSAVVNAFAGLIQQLLGESEAQLQQWREKILQAVGVNGQVIVEVIPEVELIIGKQPPVAKLGPTEAQNRFNLVFSNFIRVFCCFEHPLAIFLDDLQWADSATLKLIQLMMGDNDTQYLFVIGAYRDNEVDGTHPLMMTVEGLRKQGAAIAQITLKPLALSHISQLIADTLNRAPQEVEDLAKLIGGKTGGNPFFVNEFFHNLYSENLVILDVESRRWQWDITSIEEMGFTDNVVELMVGKLQKLPPSTQQVLSLAACLGAEFDLETLALACEESSSKVFEDLKIAIQMGIIIPLSELDVNLLIQNYKFGHDRIQQAAYKPIETNRNYLQAIHLHIGRLLAAHSKKLSEDLFKIVDHLNLGVALLDRQAERNEIAKLNLMAGQKAKQSTAYGAAIAYLTVGRELLPSNCWETNYQLTLELYKEQAEAEYLNGNFQQSETLIDRALKPIKSVVDKADFYELLIIQKTMNSLHDEAIQIGREALSLLGESLAEKNLSVALEQEQMQIKTRWGDRDVFSLIYAPEVTLPKKRQAIKILNQIFPATYFIDLKLFLYVAAKATHLSLIYGNCSESAHIYSCYAFTGYGLLFDDPKAKYRGAYELSIVALKISEKFHNLGQKCRILEAIGSHISYWVNPLSYSHTLAEENYRIGLECGEIQFVTYMMLFDCYNRFYEGYNLQGWFAELSNYLQFIRKSKNQVAEDGIIGALLALSYLSEPNFASQEIDEEAFLAQCKAHKATSVLASYLTIQSRIFYLLGCYDLALDRAREAETILPDCPGLISQSEHNFSYSLILTSLYKEASQSQQSQYREKLKENQQQMEIWAEVCAANFEHKYWLVEAEKARISGEFTAAVDLYDRAIDSAKKYQFIQNEALANELAATLYLDWGKEKIARIYLQDARNCYQYWGATNKVKQLDEKYSYLQQIVLTKERTLTPATPQLKTTGNSTTLSKISDRLDIATILKTSQALSSEIQLDKLLVKLMQLIFTNGGAQKGCLILARDKQLLVQASGTSDQSNIEVLQAIPALNYSEIPHRLINTVSRTRKTIVLDNATEEGNFTSDPYIQQQQCQSILCTPLTNQNRMSGILYLENNLTANAFTSDRVEILQIICSQAAISIENARLYAQLEDYSQHLEQKVEERTQELSKTVDILKSTQAELKIENDLLRSGEEPSTFDYQVGGSLPMNAPTYVVRSADRQLYKALTKGEFCYILNARQMGKSSLRVRLMKQLKTEGINCAAIDLSEISDLQVLPEQWYAGLAYLLVNNFNLLDRVNIRSWWSERNFLPSSQRLSEFIETALLPNLSGKIAIFIDEIDSVLNLNFDPDPLFKIIRSCYNKKADSPDFNRLSFILIGAAAPYQLIQDKQSTPFNIGQGIQLAGFRQHEAQPLLYGLSERVTNPQTLLTEILAWTGGQPFLTQKLCKIIRNDTSTIPMNREGEWVEQLVRTHILANWETQDEPQHLRTIRDRLLQDKQKAVKLLEIYRQILQKMAGLRIGSFEQTDLLMSGLVVNRDGVLQVGNRIYESIFDQSWIEKTLDRLSSSHS